MSVLRKILTCTDLNRVSAYDRSLLWRADDVFRCDGFFSVDAATSVAEIPDHCRSLSGRLQDQDLPVRRAFPGDGICATDVPAEPAGYRSLSSGDGSEAVSYGDSQHGVPEQPVQRERKPRLADLCRVRADSDPADQGTLCQRFGIPRPRRHRLCARFHNDRPVYGVVPVGAFPEGEKRGEDAHAAEPVRQHSRVYPDNRGQSTSISDGSTRCTVSGHTS